jgi:AmpD protein
MRIDTATGWIEGVRRVESPNFDARPPGCEPELIVIHGISLPPGEFGGSSIDELFCNALDPGAHPYFEQICHLRVSSHVLIGRAGAVTQYVSFRHRAWHAGESSYCGRRACNDFSIGIELEGTDDRRYEPVQYARLAQIVRVLKSAYASLAQAELVGHSDIAPGRKTDPGPHFDWDLLRQQVVG